MRSSSLTPWLDSEGIPLWLFLFILLNFFRLFFCLWVGRGRSDAGIVSQKKMVSSSFFVFINFIFGRVKVDEAAADDDERRRRKTNKKNKK